jgi:Concanavalin A-like lectin/glucanases superfamily
MRYTLSLTALALAALLVAPASAALKDGLTFYSSFDHGPNADFAKGDAKLYTAPAIKFPPQATPGLPASGFAAIAKGQGKYGDCLHFSKKVPDMVFYYAKGNVAFDRSDWDGTVSFWLRLTPDEDLQPGYVDPIQITSQGWDHAAFWIDFTQEKPRAVRLGVLADFDVWNPQKREWDSIPMKERPLITIEKPPFRRDHWSHVAFTFEKFNTGKADGVARLYIDGQPQGQISPRTQTFTWDMEKALIMPGLSYTGYWDELAIFDRALSAAEVKELHGLNRPLVTK